jgi:hypothetical protein
MILNAPFQNIIFWLIFFLRCKHHLSLKSLTRYSIHWINIYLFLFAVSFLSGYHVEILFNEALYRETGVFFPWATTLRNIIYGIMGLNIFYHCRSADLEDKLKPRWRLVPLTFGMLLTNVAAAYYFIPFMTPEKYIVVHWWHGALLCPLFGFPIALEYIYIFRRFLLVEKQFIMKLRYTCTYVYLSLLFLIGILSIITTLTFHISNQYLFHTDENFLLSVLFYLMFLFMLIGNLPDKYLLRFFEMIKILLFFRLSFVEHKVMVHSPVQSLFKPTKTNVFNSASLANGIYQKIISILDYYPYLVETDRNFYEKIRQAEQTSSDYTELMWRLVFIK